MKFSSELTRRPHKTKQGHFLGWHRALSNTHERFSFFHDARADDGSPIDLSSGFPLPILDQGQLGACGPNSLSEILTFDQAKLGLPVFQPSRLFLYWNVRSIEGTTDQDAGVNNDDLGTALMATGYCDESLWPYDVSQFAVQPPQAAFDAGSAHETQTLAVGQDVGSVRQALLAGFPVLTGFTVYESFESDAVASTGVVPMPGPAEQILGGHDVVCVGHDPSTGLYKCRNSWGAGWGQQGYFQIPDAYFSDPNLAGDFKTIQHVV